MVPMTPCVDRALPTRPLAYLMLLIGGWLVMLAELLALLGCSISLLAQVTRCGGVVIVMWATSDDWLDFKKRLKAMVDGITLQDMSLQHEGEDASQDASFETQLPTSTMTSYANSSVVNVNHDSARRWGRMTAPMHRRGPSRVDTAEETSSNSSPCSATYCDSHASSSSDDAECNSSSHHREFVDDLDDPYSGPHDTPYRPYVEPPEREVVPISLPSIPLASPGAIANHTPCSPSPTASRADPSVGPAALPVDEGLLSESLHPSSPPPPGEMARVLGEVELPGLLGMARRAGKVQQGGTPAGQPKGMSKVIAELRSSLPNNNTDHHNKQLHESLRFPLLDLSTASLLPPCAPYDAAPQVDDGAGGRRSSRMLLGSGTYHSTSSEQTGKQDAGPRAHVVSTGDGKHMCLQMGQSKALP